MMWIQGVHAKDFPVISINNHAVWQTTLPSEDVVVSWLHWPSSIDEAVETILAEMPSETLGSILNSPLALAELGQGIRNGFGLWTGNVPLRKDCGSEDIDADRASTVIIEALKKRCFGPTARNTGPITPKNAPQFILTWAFNSRVRLSRL